MNTTRRETGARAPKPVAPMRGVLKSPSPGGVALAAFAIAAAAWGLAPAAEKAKAPWLAQGPAQMSEEEMLLQPEPDKGIEHGVILFVEFRNEEDDPRELRIGMHLRAKIFSNEARDLGNVEIPYDVGIWDLREWWGRVIQPDGTVLELSREDLTEHTLARSRGREIAIRKGALPGIVPGSVIDYGYVLEQLNARTVAPWWRFRLQWAWPVRELRYTWTPYEYLPSGFVTTRTGEMDVTARRDAMHVKVLGRNLPPIEEEPFMPPADSLRASVWFFYFNKDENYKDFWNDKAKLVDSRAAAFMSHSTGSALLAEIATPDGADLEPKLRRVYEWIQSSIAIKEEDYEEGISSLRADWAPKKPKSAAEISSLREGAGVHRILMMMGLARELGAEAHIVLAADRTERFWNRSVLTMAQLDEALVAVRAPGSPAGKATLLAPHLDLPYGVVPYWVAGAEAMVATAAGYQAITPPSSSADDNASISTVKVSFDGEGEPARAVWHREGKGQHALELQLAVKRSDEEAKRERLEAICGKSGSFELEEARSTESGGAGSARIECEGLLPDVVAEPGLEVVSFPLKGPWIEGFPELETSERTHPLVFDYPCSDRTVVEVEAPPGFRAAPAPAPVVIDNPFGKYALKVTGTESGYTVERELRLPHLSLPANRNSGLGKFLQQVRSAEQLSLTFEPEASE